MLKVLCSGAAGLSAQMLKLDATANNLANLDTPGYKKSRVTFFDLLSQEIENSGVRTAHGGAAPVVRNSVDVAEVDKVFKQGDIVKTHRPLDLTISGEGYFKVLLDGGEEGYTRDGSFSLDREGNLVTSSGYRLEGVKAPPGADRVTVTSKGAVQCATAKGIKDAGQIVLYKFEVEKRLQPEGKNVFSAGTAGQIFSGEPGSQGYGIIRQHCLEISNVELMQEMLNMIEIQHAAGFFSRILRSSDEMWGMANNMRK